MFFRLPAPRLKRSSWGDAIAGFGLIIAGSMVLVAMAMVTVSVEETHRKAASIVLAVAGMWLLSRGGALLYRILLPYPQ